MGKILMRPGYLILGGKCRIRPAFPREKKGGGSMLTAIISLGIIRNSESLHQAYFTPCFGWNSPNGSGEKRFLDVVNVFLLFSHDFPNEKGLYSSFE